MTEQEISILVLRIAQGIRDRYIPKEGFAHIIHDIMEDEPTFFKDVLGDPRVTPTLEVQDLEREYDGNPVLASEIQFTATATGDDGEVVNVPGTLRFTKGSTVTELVESGTKRVFFTPDDLRTYCPVTADVNVQLYTVATAEG